jgi:hypothetical protein
MAELTAAQAETFERCMAVGGMAVFPADTVYGVACDPDAKEAVQRICLLKRRPISKPSAVMFFQPSLALAALPELGPRTRDALLALLPGAVTLVLPNPAGRFPLAAGEDRGTIGLRVPALPPALAPLRALLAAEPGLAADVVLGIRGSGFLGDRFADTLLDAWAHGRSALRVTLPDPPALPGSPPDVRDGVSPGRERASR